jgi:hypothetical protein
MAKIGSVLAEVGELLAVLTAKLESATVDEMPALFDEARDAARTILRCCLASDPTEHLPPEEVAALRAELVKLGRSLEAQIVDIVDIRWTQLGGPEPSRTRH